MASTSSADHERITDDLVPLVRAAADEVLVGDVPHLPIEEPNVSGFRDRWGVHVHAWGQDAMNRLIAEMLKNAPVATRACDADVMAAIREAMRQAEEAPPPGPATLFMTRRQIDQLRERETAKPYIRRPYDSVIAELAGIRIVALPKRTRWQRFRARLRQWRWWR